MGEKTISLKTDFEILKTFVTGIVMGLANLVPGVSGGTMVLALGLYEKFIESFANISRGKFKKESVVFVSILFAASSLSIFLFSTPMQFLMESYRWAMLSVFIGLTLGGVPLLTKEFNKKKILNYIFVFLGILLMILVGFIFRPTEGDFSYLYLFIGGMIGASAMILPGISGSYILLIMGIYIPIISALSEFKGSLFSFNILNAFNIGLTILLPVGLGVLSGLFLFSNILKKLLEIKKDETESFLLGLLLGSVFGLYPFSAPQVDKLFKYSVLENDTAVLRIIAQNLNMEHEMYKTLQAFENEKLKVEISLLDTEKLSEKIVDRAKDSKSILISLNETPGRQIQDYAKADHLKVPLFVFYDSSISTLRVFLSFLFMLCGLLLTYALSKIK
jgi:putative membrane protein